MFLLAVSFPSKIVGLNRNTKTRQHLCGFILSFHGDIFLHPIQGDLGHICIGVDGDHLCGNSVTHKSGTYLGQLPTGLKPLVPAIHTLPAGCRNLKHFYFWIYLLGILDTSLHIELQMGQ